MRDEGATRVLLGLEFPQPSLNVREQMRLVAVRTSQGGYPSRQGSEGLGIEIDTGIHFSPCRWAVKFQQCHRVSKFQSLGFCRVGISNL
jgi:hypothetical protein